MPCVVQQLRFSGSFITSHTSVWASQVCKYGVVGLSALQDDLTTWQRMYVSGRLQKPVLTLVPCPSLESALQHNLLSAATVSLLLLPPSFSLQVTEVWERLLTTVGACWGCKAPNATPLTLLLSCVITIVTNVVIVDVCTHC